MNNVFKTSKVVLAGATTLAFTGLGMTTNILPATLNLVTNHPAFLSKHGDWKVVPTNVSADTVSSSNQQSPDWLPTPQRWVVSPKATSKAQVTVSGGAVNKGYFTNFDDARKTEAATANSTWTNADGMQISETNPGNTVIDVNSDSSVVSVEWDNAGTIDGVPVKMHTTFSNFKSAWTRDGNLGRSMMIGDSPSTFVSLYNSAAAIKVWFTYETDSQWGNVGDTVNLRGDGDTRGPVYISWGSLSFDTEDRDEQGKVSGRREMVSSNDIKNFYYSPNWWLTLSKPAGSMKGYPISGAMIGGAAGDDIQKHQQTGNFGDDADNSAFWLKKIGVTVSPSTDTPTFYAGSVTDDNLDALFTPGNHLMMTNSTSIDQHPKPTPPAPTKTVSDGGSKDLNGKATSTKEHRIYTVSQNLPTMPYSEYFYKNMIIKDTLPSAAKMYYTADGKFDASKTGTSEIEKMSDIKVVNEKGEDMTSHFTIIVSGQDVTATADSAWLKGLVRLTVQRFTDTPIH
jgi:hypothetical protein